MSKECKYDNHHIEGELCLTCQHDDLRSRLDLATEHVAHMGMQIDRLAKFIMDEVPGEPSQSEGAVDTAIRIMRNLRDRLEAAKEALAFAACTIKCREPWGDTCERVIGGVLKVEPNKEFVHESKGDERREVAREDTKKAYAELCVYTCEDSVTITIGDGSTGYRVVGPKMYVSQSWALLKHAILDKRAAHYIVHYLKAAGLLDLTDEAGGGTKE
jgi:hypothetical protein